VTAMTGSAQANGGLRDDHGNGAIAINPVDD
jgi:hypothetical protein